MAKLQFKRDVDTRSVIFENGVTLLFSDHIAETFEIFLKLRQGPEWLYDGWLSTLAMINEHNLTEPEQKNVIMFLLGQADYILMYQQS